MDTVNASPIASPAATLAADKPSQGQIWFMAIRPKTLTASLAPTLLGWALAWSDGIWQPGPAVVFLVGFLLLQIVSNLVNDYSDFARGADTAERVGPARVTQKGWLTPREVATGAALAFAGSSLALLYLSLQGGWPVLLGGLFSMAGAVLYTAGPVPLGYLGLGDILVLLISGFSGVCGSYFVVTHEMTPKALLCGLAMGFLAAAILAVNNLRDRKTDPQAGKRTLVVRFGQRFGQVEYTLMMVGAFAIPVLGWALLPDHHKGWLLGLAGLPLAVAEVKAIWTLDGAALNPHLGKTALIGLVLALLLSAGFLL
jgi:1,4-dihydroxy-2-naphthoate polyprenyltransferase